MDHVEQLNRAPGLVGLQMTHKMPTGSVAANLVYFRLSFLHAVLTKIGHTGRKRLKDDSGAVSLADRNQFYLVRRSTGPHRGCFYPRSNVLESFAYGLKCGWFCFHRGRQLNHNKTLRM